MKQLVKVLIWTAFISIIATNFFIKSNPFQHNDVCLIHVKNIAHADGEAAQCLFLNVFEGDKGPQRDKKCYRDQPGEDLFEGYVIKCPSGGAGCQPSFCLDSQGCYTLDI